MPAACKAHRIPAIAFNSIEFIRGLLILHFARCGDPDGAPARHRERSVVILHKRTISPMGAIRSQPEGLPLKSAHSAFQLAHLEQPNLACCALTAPLSRTTAGKMNDQQALARRGTGYPNAITETPGSRVRQTVLNAAAPNLLATLGARSMNSNELSPFR